jgi:hypothetical protein
MILFYIQFKRVTCTAYTRPFTNNPIYYFYVWTESKAIKLTVALIVEYHINLIQHFIEYPLVVKFIY